MTSNTPGRFSIPTVEKCCCLKLKTGGIIVACIWLIPVLLAVGLTGWEMISLAKARSRIRTSDEFLNVTEEFESLESWHDSYIVQCAMFHAFALVLLVTCVLHIYGAVKERRLYMIPFTTFVGLVSNTIICSELLRILLLTTSFIGFLISVLLGAIMLYSLLILVSYYRELQQKPHLAKEHDNVIEAIEEALW